MPQRHGRVASGHATTNDHDRTRTGATLAYLVLAKGLSVLLGQAGTCVQAMLTVYNYLSFITLMLVVFGASFELPGRRAASPAAR